MKASLLAKGFDLNDGAIRVMCEGCFNNADVDKNGELDLEEFQRAVMTSEVSLWKLRVRRNFRDGSLSKRLHVPLQLGVQLFWQSEHRERLEPLLKPMEKV